MLSVAALGALANTAEISTNNIRSGASVDTIKASWGQAIKVGDFSTNMEANYDSSVSKDWVKDVSFSGDIGEGDMGVSYEISHDFGDDTSGVKLSKEVGGITVSVDSDLSTVTEVSAAMTQDLGDQSVDVDASFLVASNTARVKLMSKLSGGDTLTAEVNYKPDDGSTTYNVEYDHNLSDGKDLHVEVGSDSGDVKVDYVDSKFEDGAVWTASASVPTNGAANDLLDKASLSLKRAWKW